MWLRWRSFIFTFELNSMLKRTCFRLTGLIACFILIADHSNSQDLLRSYELSSIKVDKLSDAEIAKFKQQLDASGLTEDQAEQIAVSKGMPVTEVQKLRVRLQQLPP